MHDRSKIIVFSLITALIPVLFFILLEGALRMANYGGDQSLFIYPEDYDGELAQLNPRYHDKFFARTSTYDGGRGSAFLREKPEDGFRVFVMGASTTIGFPYGHNGMFSLVVEDMLKDVLPGRNVEVINIGLTATNTYTVYDQSRKLLDHEPDAVLIYSGQNEFYGALGVASSERMGQFPAFVRFRMRLMEMRTAMLVQDGVDAIAGGVRGWFAGDRRETGTLMERMARDQHISLDSPVYQAGVRQYRSNLELIVTLFQENDVPVFMASLASNLKDQPPFVSVSDEGQPSADDVYDDALRVYQNDNYDRALEQFRVARDLDALRFRAPSAFNDIIREKADHQGVHYVPVKETLSAHAANGIIGNDLMLEHLHPNEKGYFLLGKTFFEAIIASEMPGIRPDLTRLRSMDHYRQARYLTELDRKMAWHPVERLKNSWPFTDEHDPEGYPANYSPETPTDRLAWEFFLQQKTWLETKMHAAQWFAENGQYEAALDEMHGVMRVMSYDDEPYSNAARIAMRAGKVDAAAEYLESAYKIRPTNYVCRTLANIEANRDNAGRAAHLYEEAFRLDNDDHASLFNASFTHVEAGNLERAITLAEELNTLDPNFPDLQRWRIHLMQRAGQQRP